MNRLLSVMAFPILLTGCGLGTGPDVRAYNTGLFRHPQDAMICEGPPQAYELEPSIVQARTAASN
jgi:hypothetical protein